MRPIKYRQPTFIQWKFDGFHYWWFIDDVFYWPLTWRHLSVSQQFTWLYDKNGKEIYEKSVIDNDYEVNFIFPWYILKNIYNGDIITFQNYEWQLQITKEYSEL